MTDYSGKTGRDVWDVDFPNPIISGDGYANVYREVGVMPAAFARGGVRFWGGRVSTMEEIAIRTERARSRPLI